MTWRPRARRTLRGHEGGMVNVMPHMAPLCRKLGGDSHGHEETWKRRTSLQAMRPLRERRYTTSLRDLTRDKASYIERHR